MKAVHSSSNCLAHIQKVRTDLVGSRYGCEKWVSPNIQMCWVKTRATREERKASLELQSGFASREHASDWTNSPNHVNSAGIQLFLPGLFTLASTDGSSVIDNGKDRGRRCDSDYITIKESGGGLSQDRVRESALARIWLLRLPIIRRYLVWLMPASVK
jgi:hypothetical protein